MRVWVQREMKADSTACCWLACQEKEELAPGILGKAQRDVKYNTFQNPGLGVNMALESQTQHRTESHHCM